MSKKSENAKPQGSMSEPPQFTGDPKPGMIVGGIIGAGLGLAFGTLSKITDLSLGPIPSGAVGLAFGAAFGAVLGGYSAIIGKGMLTPKAALGFAIGFGIMFIGRWADDTGKGYDNMAVAMDIICGGIFWGTFGAIVAASGILDDDGKKNEEAPRDSQSKLDEENVGHEGG